MNETLTGHDEMEIIESIIYSFQGYALDDLKNSHLDSSSMGILLVQVLDDLSGFFFTGTPKERVDGFVASYLPQYGGLAVYDTLKKSLLFNYVVAADGNTSSKLDDRDTDAVNSDEKFPLSGFVKDLEEGFDLAFEELRNNSEKCQFALERYKTHKVYFRACSIYTEKQKQKLRDYYLPLLTANALFYGHVQSVDLVFSPRRDRNYAVFVLIEYFLGEKQFVKVPLDFVIAWMGLRAVAEVAG